MKKTIRTLYEYYYSLKMVIDETIISGQGATMRVIVTTQLAPSVWGVKDEHGRLDIKTAEEIMFKERERLSSQLFSMTLSILKEEGKFPKIDENDKKNAEAKMKWVTDRLLELDILDPYDKMYLSTLEKDGVEIGQKRVAEKDDEEHPEVVKEAMKWLEPNA